MGKGTLLVDHTPRPLRWRANSIRPQPTKAWALLIAVSGGRVPSWCAYCRVGRLTQFNRMVPLPPPQAITLLVPEPQICKMVNQICTAGLVQACPPSLWKAAGLDMKQVLDVIGVRSTKLATDNRGHTMVDDKFDSAQVDWMRKDLNLVFEARAQWCASRNGAG